jgi:hypothetical protein
MTRNARAGAIAFVAAAATLAAQVSVHRLVSAKMLNNFAFFVLSLTMLGFAVSGAWLARRRGRSGEPLGDAIVTGAALFAAGLVVATAVMYPSPPVEDWGGGSRASVLLGFLACLPLGLLYAAAFAGSGLVLGTLLSSPALPTRRLYALDLAGSAAGAVAVVPAISALGAERAAVACGTALLLTAGALVPPRARAARVAAALAAAGLLAAAVAPDLVFRMRYARDSFLGQTQAGAADYELELVRWDPVSRIEVSRVPPPQTDGSAWPSLFGPDREMLGRFRRVITQNNNAFTYAPDYDGRPETVRGLGQTVYAAAYQALEAPGPRVLVIGVGGGVDVLTALAAGASSVTGVEVNRATLEIVRDAYRDYFRPWVDDPRVRLVHGEGRHFLASRPDRYDVLQLSGVDSVSGTPGAAHVFSESYLYTAEAFDLYLSRLTPRGVLNVMRPDTVPPRDTLRLLATALESLGRRGLERPADHVLVVADGTGRFVAVLASLQPFSPDQAARVGAWAAGTRFLSLVAGPGASPSPPASPYAALLSAPSAGQLRAALARYPWDVLPVGDDRPFFFRTSRWSHLWPRPAALDPGTPVMELGLLALLAVCVLATVALVYVPLRGLRGRGGPRAGRLAVFFGALGFGYMAVEMAFIQKFGLLLGHPNHALTIVLAALLFATGVGSLLSAGILGAARGRLRFVAYGLAALLLAEAALVFPRLASWVGLPFAVRAAIVVALLFPVGLLLGAFFPTGLDRLKAVAPGWAPWAWGLNGMASVVAPVVSVGVSMTLGISVLLLTAVPVYLIAGWSEPVSPTR